MRILGIETSCTRGSVALLDGERVVGFATQDEPNRHGERMLPLIEGLLANAGWERSSIERVAVGVGPGSFTGLRVGIALATGLGMGLSVPVVGVGSLAALAEGHGWDESSQLFTAERDELRVVVRDARRSEYFLAAYTPDGEEVLAPRAVPQAMARDVITGTLHEAGLAERPFVVLGTAVEGLPGAEGPLTRDPDARATAHRGARLAPESHPAVPHYVRGPNAIKPALPPSPLESPRA